MTARSTQLDLAVDFALLTSGGAVQPWMAWSGWLLHVGCDECADAGMAAGCWGLAGCHGYLEDCGCVSCAARQAGDRARCGALTPAGATGSLGAELAAVTERIGSSDDRRDG